MELTPAKILALFLLAILSLIFGLIPIFFKKWVQKRINKFERTLSLILCLGAGVLLSLAFIHIIPEARHGIENNIKEGQLKDFNVPFNEFLICCGLFTAYIIEEVVYAIYDLCNGSKEKTIKEEVIKCEQGNEGIPDDQDGVGKMSQKKLLISAVHNFLMILALSFHEVLEGMILGIQKNTDDVWVLFAAISLHKFPIMFCVSVRLIMSCPEIWLQILYILTYGLITSTGAGIGVAVYEHFVDTTTDAPIFNILQAVAAGTILYVVFFEILFEERKKDGSPILKLMMILLGFGILTTFDAIFDDTHAHSHG